MMTRGISVRVIRPGDNPPVDEVRRLTAAERLAMMWQLAMEAWAFKGEPVGESILSQHAVRVRRGGG